MKISYNWLQSHFNEKLPAPEKLAELLTMHSQEVESVEKREMITGLTLKFCPPRLRLHQLPQVTKRYFRDFKIGGENFFAGAERKEIIFVKESDFEKILGGKNPRGRNIGDIKAVRHGSWQKGRFAVGAAVGKAGFENQRHH